MIIRVLLPAMLFSPVAVAECVQVDSERSELRFEVEQAGSAFNGTFSSFGGEVCTEKGNITRIHAWLDPASVETGLPELDAALREKEFFDVAEHQRATFTSESIVQDGEEFIARGQLEIKGVTQTEAVPFALADGTDGSRLSGTFTIDRLDYELGTGEWADTRWLAPEVSVSFEAFLPREAESN